MAAVMSPYLPHAYHHQSALSNTNAPIFYKGPSTTGTTYRPVRSQKAQPKPKTTAVPAADKVEVSSPPSRSRREPRIHRQVIRLPTPEPIYRQVRHRLPTPERSVIQRTVIQKANGDVIIEQERHRKNVRSHSQTVTTRTTRTSRTRKPTSNQKKTNAKQNS